MEYDLKSGANGEYDLGYSYSTKLSADADTKPSWETPLDFVRDIPGKATFTIIDNVRKPTKKKNIIGVAEIDFSKYLGKKI